MAQPEPHIEVDLQPGRKLVKRAIKDLEEANREFARSEQRIRELEERLASEYGIRIERTNA